MQAPSAAWACAMAHSMGVVGSMPTHTDTRRDRETETGHGTRARQRDTLFSRSLRLSVSRFLKAELFSSACAADWLEEPRSCKKQL